MEIHENNLGARLQRVDLPPDDRERVVDARHEDATHDIDDANRPAIGGTREIAAVAGHTGRVIGRPEQAWLRADVVDGFLLRPDVIARGHDIDAPAEDLVADFTRDPGTGRGVLRVGDHQVDLMMIDESSHAAAHEIASRFSDNVADEEDAHAA
jgi:hypothetical protein